MIATGGSALLHPPIHWNTFAGNSTLGAIATMDAATEKVAFIGHVKLAGVAEGGTKTLSAAGSGKIAWRSGAVTFANGATALDLGIQGISTAAGLPVRPDGTYTVLATLVPGVDTITGTAENTHTMDSGSATMTNGALVAVVWDMTARAGADSVVVTAFGAAGTITTPVVTPFLAGAWQATNLSSLMPVVRFECDDGTLGYLEYGASVSAASSEVFADATNPDERGNIIQYPYNFTAAGIWMIGGVTDVNSDFTYNAFSDPTGTPTGLTGASGTYDSYSFGGTGGQDRLILLPFSADVSITRNTDYCTAIRATGTTNARLASWTVSAAVNKTWFGNGTAGKTTRDEGTGAFAAKSATVGYFMGFYSRQIDDGTGASGNANILRGSVVA